MANHVDGLDLDVWGDVPPLPPRERTHYERCWKSHLECAVAKIEQMEAERDAAKIALNEFEKRATETVQRVADERDAATTRVGELKEEVEKWRLDSMRACHAAQTHGFLLESHSGAADAMEFVLAEYRALARLAIDGLDENQKKSLAAWLDRAVGKE